MTALLGIDSTDATLTVRKLGSSGIGPITGFHRFSPANRMVAPSGRIVKVDWAACILPDKPTTAANVSTLLRNIARPEVRGE